MCFCFLCFLCSQKKIENNKKIFSLFFHCSKSILFFVFFFFFLYVFLTVFLYFHKGKLHSTTTPSPVNPFFFLKLLKLIYLHMVTKSNIFCVLLILKKKLLIQPNMFYFRIKTVFPKFSFQTQFFSSENTKSRP